MDCGLWTAAGSEAPRRFRDATDSDNKTTLMNHPPATFPTIRKRCRAALATAVHIGVQIVAFACIALAEEPRAHPFLDSRKMIQKLGREWEPPPVGARGIDVEPPPSVTMTVLFKYDSTEIADEESMKQLAEAAKAFNSPELRGFKFIVEGHTDADGEEGYNQALSDRRAAAIIKLLTERQGVPAAMLTPQGKGETEPVADNTSDPGKQKNRRVVIVRAK